MIQQDLRYALRTLASQPSFAAVAVLSLALGIGANLAIFSLLANVLMSALPVRDPQALVMLTNPAASGVSEQLQSNERALLTYADWSGSDPGHGGPPESRASSRARRRQAALISFLKTL